MIYEIHLSAENYDMIGYGMVGVKDKNLPLRSWLTPIINDDTCKDLIRETKITELSWQSNCPDWIGR